MGGGDLNMKKHFHPLTMENLERVWKAEEKKRIEDERIQQLQQELAVEREKEYFEKQAIEVGLKKKKGEKLDWMYQGHQNVDTEAYLLGKRIDKNIDVAKEEEKGLSSGVIATATKTSLPKANDVLAKIKEDPLFMIKKKEEDNRKLLMANPVKLRKMKALVEKQASSLKKSHKKSKKKKYETSSSSSATSEDDEIQGKLDRKRSYKSAPSYHDKRSHHVSEESHPNIQSNERERKDRTPRDYRDRYLQQRGLDIELKISSKSDEGRDRDRFIDRKNSHERLHNGDNGSYERRKTHQHSDSSLYKSYSKDDSIDSTKYRRSEKGQNRRRRKHSSSSSDEDEELVAKRMEMMNNAKWRQSQRSRNSKNYKTEKEAEEKRLKSLSNVTEEKAYFLQKMQKDSVTSLDSSVEDRIHRNIHSKQRTNIALDRKFTAR